MTLVDGRKIATPLDWYPRLDAPRRQRANFEIMPMGIRCDLDEDLGIAGMLKGRPHKPRSSDRADGVNPAKRC